MSERVPALAGRAAAPAQPAWGVAAAAAAALAVVFAPLGPPLLQAWRTNEYAGHGPFVPVYAAFLLWLDRERLAGAPRRIEPLGVLAALAGAAAFGLGRAWESLTLQVPALVVAVAGVVLLAFGPRVLRAAAFPVAFLALMMPLPAPVVQVVTLPIQHFGAWLASAVMFVLGIPHHRDGILLELPNVALAVVEGCNGLRFLMALVTLTAAFAQATLHRWQDKVLVTVAAIPVALLANAARVTVVTLAGYYVGAHAASGLTHHSIGKGVWAAALVPLLLLGLGLRRRRAA
jgi:exosortase